MDENTKESLTEITEDIVETVKEETQEVKKMPRNEELENKKHEAIKKLPSYRGDVPSKNSIRSLHDVKVGSIFWVEMDHKPYVVAENDGYKMTIKALDETATITTGMTIYEMNHNIIAKEPLFDWNNEEVVKALDEKLQNWFYKETTDDFYLFYGRDIHYVTLVKKTDEGKSLLENLKEMIEEFSDLVSIDANDEDDKEKKLEIWVRTPYNDAELLYFFPYDAGLTKI